MAFSITELKKGTIFQIEGTPYRVMEYGQKVMGRGGSIVNVKIKSLTDGKVLDKTFKGNDQLDSADVTNANAQYLYNDGPTYYFMDEGSFEQHEVPSDIVGDQRVYLKEGDRVQAQSFNGVIINVELPMPCASTVGGKNVTVGRAGCPASSASKLWRSRWVKGRPAPMTA